MGNGTSLQLDKGGSLGSPPPCRVGGRIMIFFHGVRLESGSYRTKVFGLAGLPFS